MAEPGLAASGAVAPGFAGPGSAASGFSVPGSAPGFAVPGSAAPGSMASGAAAPGAPAPQGWTGPAVPPVPMAPAGHGHGAAGAIPPGGYGVPGYPPGYGWPGMPMPPQNGMGTTAMILGILSCVLFCMYGIFSIGLGIAAVVLGVKGKKLVDRGEATNRSQAQAGFITGIVGIVLGVLILAFFAVILVMGLMARNHETEYGSTSDSASTASAPLQVQAG
ncbi:hypothetical protein [Streptomyces sp. V3I7]|uniref:hypothetical protein n=1 Tax=Streptomyces sp. V3I7 TaxID=3042278 RepID=UPI0027D8D8CF|nr:hypothetical protein [Streptomyces sp. V3I7]